MGFAVVAKGGAADANSAFAGRTFGSAANAVDGFNKSVGDGAILFPPLLLGNVIADTLHDFARMSGGDFEPTDALYLLPGAGKVAESTLGKAAIPAAADAVPLIKAGSAGGETAGKSFPQAIKDAAKAENPLSICVYCRREGAATQVDHSIPKSRGGNATLDNAQLACPHCNASKGARDFPVNPPPGYRGEWPPSHWGQ